MEVKKKTTLFQLFGIITCNAVLTFIFAAAEDQEKEATASRRTILSTHMFMSLFHTVM